MRLRPLFLVGLVLVMTGSGVAAAAGSLAWRGLIPADTGLIAFGLAATALLGSSLSSPTSDIPVKHLLLTILLASSAPASRADSLLVLIDATSRAILGSVYADGLTSAQAAGRHGTTATAVRWRCSRDVRRLASRSLDLWLVAA